MNFPKPHLVDDDVLTTLVRKNLKKSKFKSHNNFKPVVKNVYKPTVYTNKYNNISEFFKNNWYYLLIIIFIGYLLYLKYKDTQQFKLTPAPVTREKKNDTYGRSGNLSESNYSYQYAMGGNYKYNPPPYVNENIESRYNEVMDDGYDYYWE